MNKLFFFLFVAFFLPVMGYGQGNNFTLSGKVTDCKTGQPVKDATIKLVGSDGSSVSTNTANDGTYFFDEHLIKNNISYIASVYNQNSKDYYLIGADEKYLFKTSDSIAGKEIKKDFCLHKMIRCTYGPPTIYFPKNNATTFFTADSSQDAIQIITNILEDNSNIVVEIGGHAGTDEKNNEKLSTDRAQLIRNLLIKNGIAAERLVIKSYGDKVPAYIENENGTVAKENKTTWQNRRVTISVVSNDYKSNEKNTKKVIKNEKTDDDE